MKPEHNFYPPADAENRTTPPTTPERRAPPEPTTRHEARELDRLRREHGTAFDVYLDSVWNGIETISDMESDFTNLHWGSYERIDQFIDDFIDSLGWADARDHAIREWAIPSSILIFDRAAMLEHLRGDFEFHERGGEAHVFIR